MKKAVVLGVLAVAVATSAARAAMKDAPHPFILWPKDEAAALRKRIETDPMAKKQYEKMASSGISQGNRDLWDLFNYLVMGDKAAGERQKKALVGWQNAMPEPMKIAFQQKAQDLKWEVGMPSAGDKHMRDEQSM